MQVYGKILQSENFETRHIIIHSNNVFETNTVVAGPFGYISCTI